MDSLTCFPKLVEKYNILHLKKDVEELAVWNLTVNYNVDMLLVADVYPA